MVRWRDITRLGWSVIAFEEEGDVVAVRLEPFAHKKTTQPVTEQLVAQGFVQVQDGGWLSKSPENIVLEKLFPSLNPIFDRAVTKPTLLPWVGTVSAEQVDYQAADCKLGSVEDQDPAQYNRIAAARTIGVGSDAQSSIEALSEVISEALPEGFASDHVSEIATAIVQTVQSSDPIVVPGMGSLVFNPPIVVADQATVLSGELSRTLHPSTNNASAELLHSIGGLTEGLCVNGWIKSDSVPGAIEKICPNGLYRLWFDLSRQRHPAGKQHQLSDAEGFNLAIDWIGVDASSVVEHADYHPVVGMDVLDVIDAVNLLTPTSGRAATPHSLNLELVQVSSLADLTGHSTEEVINAVESAGSYAQWAADIENQDIADTLMVARVLQIRRALLDRGWSVIESDPSSLMMTDDKGHQCQFVLDKSNSATHYNLTNFLVRLKSGHIEEFVHNDMSVGPRVISDRIMSLARSVIAVAQKTSEHKTPSDEQPVSEDKAHQSKNRERIEDVGEKIGGARKDRFMGFGSHKFADFNINAEEIDKLIDYKKIWPFSQRELKEQGGEAGVAAAMRYVRLKIRPVSSFLKTTDLTVADYVNCIELLRDRLSQVKTLAELTSAFEGITAWLNSDENWIQVSEHSRRASDAYNAMSVVLPVGWHESGVFGIRRYVYGLDEGIRMPSAVKHWSRYYNPNGTPKETAWDYLLPKRSGRNQGDTENALKTISEKDLTDPRYERTGIDWRDGRDVTAQELLETFGFRGIEFGNWVTQAERQDVINAAFDGFCDLTELLEIDRKHIGFNGKLGLAFGARGSGQACAHFEPAYNAINLTRTKGAGALAHEWAHALDLNSNNMASKGYLSEANGLNYQFEASEARFNWLSTRGDIREMTDEELAEQAHICQEKIKRWDEHASDWLLGILCRRSTISKLVHGENGVLIQNTSADRELANNLYQEAWTIALEDGKNGYWDLQEAVIDYITKKSEALIPLTAEQMKRSPRELRAGYAKTQKTGFEQIELSIRSRLLEQGRLDVFKMSSEEIADYVQQEAERIHEVRPYQSLAVSINQVVGQLASKAGMVNGRNVIHTDFFKEAKKLDAKRSKPYWGKTIELFARAFESYVFDQLEAQGCKNNYLVSTKKADGYFSGPQWVGNPYPAGAERKFINGHMHNYLRSQISRLGWSKDHAQEFVASTKNQPEISN